MFIPGAVEKPVLRIPPRTRESRKFPTQHHNRFRVTVVEIDSAGIGVMPKHPAADDGCATIPNIARYWKEFILGEFSLPNMGALGLGNIANIAGVPPAAIRGKTNKNL